MKSFRTYQGVRLSKNQADLVAFIETGSNDFTSAYFWYKYRKVKNGIKPTIQIASWFNRQLKRIKAKGILKEIPFVIHANGDCFIWANPGVNASKANYECHTLHDAQMELKSELNKVI